MGRRSEASLDISDIQSLPTLPSILGRILSTTADPEASALELGQLIASDQSLSAVLLRLVNSAYYGFPRQIQSVTQAIVMLGFIEVRNLVLGATAFRRLGLGGSAYDRTQLWRHALASAMAADRCARLSQQSRLGCFEAGLLHDIGKVVFDTLQPERFLAATGKAQSLDCTVEKTEREVFGMDHAEAGALLSDHWNLPPEIVEAIRFHLSPGEAEVAPSLAALTALASHLTYEAGLGEPSTVNPPPYPEAAAALLGFNAQMAKEVRKELEDSRERIDQFIGALK